MPADGMSIQATIAQSGNVARTQLKERPAREAPPASRQLEERRETKVEKVRDSEEPQRNPEEKASDDERRREQDDARNEDDQCADGISVGVGLKVDTRA